MMRFFAGLRIALIAVALFGVAACSSTEKPEVAGEQAATPGSERDFIVNVGDRVQFIVDQTTLTPEGQNIMRSQAQWLQQYGQVTIQVEGHADERGTREYNIALSARRAETVKISEFPPRCRLMMTCWPFGEKRGANVIPGKSPTVSRCPVSML